MPKYLIDSKFGEIIKTARIQNNIPAKTLAEKINKSPAYITKLEHGDIHSIDSEVFDSIITIIFGNNTNQNKTINTIYDSLKIKYTNEEIDNILWFQNFSTVVCQIPVPKDLIRYINSLMVDNNITIDYLLNRINSNEALSEDEKIDSSIVDNQWYFDNSNNHKHSIRIKMKKSYLESILSNNRDKSPYIFLFCVLFYIKKILAFHDNASISNEEYKKLFDETTDSLNQYKFYSITEKNKIIYGQKTTTDLTQVLNSFDLENLELLKNIIKAFKLYSELDVKQTNEYLNEFNNSLDWDLGFTFKLISLHYSKLKDISFNSKKSFINEIEKLIDKYSNSSEIKDKIDIY